MSLQVPAAPVFPRFPGSENPYLATSPTQFNGSPATTAQQHTLLRYSFHLITKGFTTSLPLPMMIRLCYHQIVQSASKKLSASSYITQEL
jgi:hypothetical protein